MPDKMSRRDFLGQTALAAAALGGLGTASTPAPAPAAEPDLLPILDTHQHLWDAVKLRPPWLDGSGALDRTYNQSDYAAATLGLNIVRSIYMEVDLAPGQWAAEAASILGLCQAGNSWPCAAVLGGDPAAPDFNDTLAAHHANPALKGVRHIPKAPGGPAFPYRQKEYVAGVRRLGELGLNYSLCAPASQLAESIRLVNECPGTRFVLDHCGNADPDAFDPACAGADSAVQSTATHGVAEHDAGQWRRDIDALAARDNVICKISGIVAHTDLAHCTPAGLAPVVNHCLDAFGPDRVVFGGDWPVCTNTVPLRHWVAVLRQIIAPRPLADQRKLLHDNAVRLYGLKPAARKSEV